MNFINDNIFECSVFSIIFKWWLISRKGSNEHILLIIKGPNKASSQFHGQGLSKQEEGRDGREMMLLAFYAVWKISQTAPPPCDPATTPQAHNLLYSQFPFISPLDFYVIRGAGEKQNWFKKGNCDKWFWVSLFSCWVHFINETKKTLGSGTLISSLSFFFLYQLWAEKSSIYWIVCYVYRHI